MIVTGPLLGQWMYERIGVPVHPDTIYIGRQRDDLSIAGVIAYNTWLEDSVFMHMALEPHAVSREFLREAFRYPFVEMGKARVYGLTPITSERALRFSKHVGFRELTRTPDFLLQVMTREECRWINDAANDGRERTAKHSASAASSAPK